MRAVMIDEKPYFPFSPVVGFDVFVKEKGGRSASFLTVSAAT